MSIFLYFVGGVAHHIESFTSEVVVGLSGCSFFLLFVTFIERWLSGVSFESVSSIGVSVFVVGFCCCVLGIVCVYCWMIGVSNCCGIGVCWVCMFSVVFCSSSSGCDSFVSCCSSGNVCGCSSLMSCNSLSICCDCCVLSSLSVCCCCCCSWLLSCGCSS